jgi:hypothetical protein
MKQQSKFNSQEQQQHTAGQQSEKQAVREFGTVEEMLRHDALHTPVPPRIALRLQQSINQMPRPASSWWRRFFGSSNP